VSACEIDPEAEAILHQAEVVSWQYDDPRKAAKPVTRTFIVSDEVEYEVAGAQVKPDAVEVPYTFLRLEDVPDSSRRYYEGCRRFVPTNRSEVYERPGSTTVAYATGDGPVQGPTEACAALTPVTQFVDKWVASNTSAMSNPTYCRYKVRSQWKREDDELVFGSWLTPGKSAGGPGNFLTDYGETCSNPEGGCISTPRYSKVGDSATGTASSYKDSICYNGLGAGGSTTLCSQLGCATQ
jgi:hypothetical protein